MQSLLSTLLLLCLQGGVQLHLAGAERVGRVDSHSASSVSVFGSIGRPPPKNDCGLELLQAHSKWCIFGQSFGCLHPEGVWVDLGCSGLFESRGRRTNCSSKEYGYVECTWPERLIPKPSWSFLKGLVDHSSFQEKQVETNIHRHKSWTYQMEEKPVQKCVYAEDLVLKCPEAGQRLGIVTAFWNRRKRETCQGEDHDPNAGLSCDRNATDKVIEMCQGQDGGSCTIPQGYTGCEENPFTFMRVRWQCISKSGNSKPEEPVEELLGMEDSSPQMELPTMPDKRVIVDENDADVKKWEKTPDRRLGVTSLKKSHCNGLKVGSWPVVGQEGCEVATKVSDFGGSSPHFYEDSVCACHFFTAIDGTDCDTLFPNPKSVYKTKAGGKQGSIAIFGKEGCDCHPDPENPKSPWTICDLAIREV